MQSNKSLSLKSAFKLFPSILHANNEGGHDITTNGAFPLQRGAPFKRAVTSAARLWLRFHLA